MLVEIISKHCEIIMRLTIYIIVLLKVMMIVHTTTNILQVFYKANVTTSSSYINFLFVLIRTNQPNP